jgi:hypothetical protein
MRQIALSLGRFFRQDVAFERMLPFDLAGAGKRKTLLCTGLGLHFWHCSWFILN